MEILYQDKDIVVCVKDVGIDSEHEMPTALKEQLGGEIYTLHRLDKNVGGVMVYARTKGAAALFSKMIQNGDLVKEYVALVHGCPPEEGDWEDLLWKDSKKADEAAKVMKITAKELKDLGIIEYVIAEKEPASRETLPQIQKILDHALMEFFERWSGKEEEELVNCRYERFRKF